MQKLIILILFSLLLGACSWLKSPNMSWANLPDVYTVPRYQGNILEQKTVNQLQPGMSREQVTFVMGTPLIQDAYFPDRWDYVYTTQFLQQPMTEEHLTLYFEGDSLAKLEGDYKPEPVAEGVNDSTPENDSGKKVVAAAAHTNAQTQTSGQKPSQTPGEDTSVDTGGVVNAIKPEGAVTETGTNKPTAKPTTDPYQGLTPDGKLATPTPTSAVH